MSAPKPTGPGWWWAEWANTPAEVVWWSDNLDSAHPSWSWITPIPSPAVCEAVARYAEALLASHADSTNASYRGESEDHFFARTSAQQALVDAIQAERDGAA